MILYIRQPAGLGDIFFLQKAASYYIRNGFEIIWPVIKHYEYIKQYNLNDKIKYISFDDLSEDIKKIYTSDQILSTNDYLYIPFDHACGIINDCDNFMDSKYKLLNITYKNWQDYVKFKRYPDKEICCREKFGLKPQEKFIFVNSLFASPPKIYKRNISIQSNIKIIEQKEEHLHEINFFDLSWILENAEEIHTVETSLCYLIECLKTTNKLFVYNRIIDGAPQHSNFDYIRKIYKKDWNYIV